MPGSVSIYMENIYMYLIPRHRYDAIVNLSTVPSMLMSSIIIIQNA